MAEEYTAIKNRMAELREERHQLLDHMEIYGCKENDRKYKQAEEMRKELMRLNKKLLHLNY